MMKSIGLKAAALTAATLLGLFVVGCGDPVQSGTSSTTASSSGAGGEAGTGGGGSGGGGTGGMGGMGGSGGGSSDPCAAQNSLCVDLLVPIDAMEAPKSIAVTAYSNLPAMGPPDGGILFNMPMPMVTPNTAYKVQISDLSLSGDYFVYAVMFMPNGGTFQPVIDVDYDVSTPMKVTFNGAPVTLPALQLAKHVAGDGHSP